MAQNFIDHRLSSRVCTQFRRVLNGRTLVKELLNGSEVRNSYWKMKRYSFHANYAQLGEASQNELTAAFFAADAMRLLFRFRDPGDNKVVSAPLAVQPGTLAAVQLTKRYTFGSVAADRTIQAVRTCKVVDSDGAAVPGTFDSALGLFTPTNNWANKAHFWSGTFDCWVRFASDEFDGTMVVSDLVTADVELVERIAMR